MSDDNDRFTDENEDENAGNAADDDENEDDSTDDGRIDDVSTDDDDRIDDVSIDDDGRTDDDRIDDVSIDDDTDEPDTETGLEPNIAAALSYLFAPLTGVLFYLLEPENEFVRFHSVQSILVFGGVIVAGIAMTILAAVLGLIPFVGWLGALLVLLATMFLPLIAVVLWILLIVKAYQGEEYAVPGFESVIRKHATTD